MIAALRHFLRGQPGKPLPAVPDGQRVYAIGDIHGRIDLFVALANAIDADDAERQPAETTVILLGDLIDRGPDSAAVIEWAMGWQSRRKVRVIAGNHEEMMLLALRRKNAFRTFLRVGGRETILSYPVDAAAFHTAELDAAQAMARRAVPRTHVAFLAGLEDHIRVGDYLFVHAGIRPGLPLDEQRLEDLRWIREPFLTSADDHGCVVVHGHTISDEPAIMPNRIGIDTGAFMSGRLTALGLEGSARWLIETCEHDDGVVALSARAPGKARATPPPPPRMSGRDAPGSL